jgi:hypothetical protein
MHPAAWGRLRVNQPSAGHVDSRTPPGAEDSINAVEKLSLWVSDSTVKVTVGACDQPMDLLR